MVIQNSSPTGVRQRCPKDGADDPPIHYEGPLSEIVLNVPAPVIESRDGFDHITLPGHPDLMVPGNPQIPSYTVTIDFPPLMMVQSVTLAERSAPQVVPDLDLPPIAIVIPDGISQPEPPPPPLATVWPEPEFAWETRNNADGSTRLFLTVYPVRYDAGPRVAQITSRWQFNIDSAESSVSIASIDLSQREYAAGDPISAAVELFNAQLVPSDVQITAELHSDDGTPLAQPVSRVLRGLTSWATWQHEWDELELPPGSYTLDLTVEDSQQGIVLDRETAEITLAPAGRLLNLAVEPRGFHLGDSVHFSGIFENTGTTSLDGTITFVVQDAEGQIEHTIETPFSDLGAGQSLRIASTWTATLVPRNTVVLAYAETSGGDAAARTAADWRDAPMLWSREAIRIEGDDVVLAWPSVTGRTYTVLASPDLRTPMPVASDLPATPPMNTLAIPFDSRMRFFFVREN